MKLIDKLDLLMSEKGINKVELSNQSGIPYTTIVNFYAKGTDNAKLSTLLKLSRYFKVTIDYIADDEVEERYRLPREDDHLIKLWRQLTYEDQIKMIGRIEDKLEECATSEEQGNFLKNVEEM